MIAITIVVRESGKAKPDYSLEFNLPAITREGDYISVQRPDQPKPFGEDMIVRKVWWRLHHPVTASYEDDRKRGGVTEIFVECDPALGPWSSKSWRQSLELQKELGSVEEFKVERLSWHPPE